MPETLHPTPWPPPLYLSSKKRLVFLFPTKKKTLRCFLVPQTLLPPPAELGPAIGWFFLSFLPNRAAKAVYLADTHLLPPLKRCLFRSEERRVGKECRS